MPIPPKTLHEMHLLCQVNHLPEHKLRQLSIVGLDEFARLNAVGTGKLKYNWANISSFCFTTDFIRKAQAHIEQTGQYHLARKQIPSVLGPVQASVQTACPRQASCICRRLAKYLH